MIDSGAQTAECTRGIAPPQRLLTPVGAVRDSEDPRRVLVTYAALYLREEVQMEGLVRKIGHFSRFLEVVSFSHASPLNISSVARECQVRRKTVEGYLGVLEDLLPACRVPVFTRRAKRALAAHPKLFLFDAGVYRSPRLSGTLDRPEEIGGHALEGLVGRHLRAWIDYSRNGADLFFWRTRSGVEVDFVVYGPDGLFGLEVKNRERVRQEDLRSLRAFRDECPESGTFLLCRGSERLVRGGTLCLPCGEFLRSLRPGVELGRGLQTCLMDSNRCGRACGPPVAFGAGRSPSGKDTFRRRTG